MSTHHSILLLISLLLFSCSVLKNKEHQKTDSAESTEIITKEKTATASSAVTNRVLFLSDSSGTHFITEIIPEGEFHITSDGAFRGKASLIRIEGNSKTYSVRKDSLSLSEHSASGKEASVQGKTIMQKSSVASKKEVKNKGFPVVLYLIPAAVLAALIFRAFRKCLMII